MDKVNIYIITFTDNGRFCAHNHVCLHGGTCQEYGDYACLCPDGYKGTFCEMKGNDWKYE